MTTNFMQQVGVPHCNFCHKCHKILTGGTGSIICNDGGIIYTIASVPTPCTKDCKMYDGTPVLKDEPIKMKTQKIIAYATNQNGDGYVTKIGEYDDLEAIEIYVGHFADDVVISFEVEDCKGADR